MGALAGSAYLAFHFSRSKSDIATYSLSQDTLSERAQLSGGTLAIEQHAGLWLSLQEFY